MMECVQFDALACPFDGLRLEENEGVCVCGNGHAFDVAKSGYINLLPNTLKGAREPGDNVDMVKARTAFLNTGAYVRLRDALVRVVQDEIARQGVSTGARIVDAGCGEGYYTHGIAEALQAGPEGMFAVLGFDISKPAVMAASKRTKDVRWAVANNKSIPVVSGQGHVVLSLFGFPVYSEFKRILADNGCLVLVDTGPQHMVELRRELYDDIKVKALRVEAAYEEQFQLMSAVDLTYEAELATSDEVWNLIEMTPHAYRVSAERVARVVDAGVRRVTFDFRIQVCVPRA